MYGRQQGNLAKKRSSGIPTIWEGELQDNCWHISPIASLDGSKKAEGFRMEWKRS
jgi:hypothetical protein